MKVRHTWGKLPRTHGAQRGRQRPRSVWAEPRGRPGNLPRVRPTRAAAVLLAIFADPPHPVVFIERAAHLRDHPGQIGFPGGSVDAADGDDRARTVLRELHEELGVGAERVTLVGRLPDVRQQTNNFIVTPFVGVLRSGTPLTIDATETAAVFTAPLEALVAPGAVHPGIETFGEYAVETWVFDYGDLHVWGLTASILHEFTAAWNSGDSPLCAAVHSALGSPV
jgi:8-oxo-dGTP pyrophosphatase MutT (NUDIX family)